MHYTFREQVSNLRQEVIMSFLSIRNYSYFCKALKLCKGRERCFVIGNGPSLNRDELDCLRDEITFVCNRFYKIYDGWNGTFYCCQDEIVFRNNKNEIEDYDSKFKVLNIHPSNKEFIKKHRDYIYLNVRRFRYRRGKNPKFSKRYLFGTYDGFTVTYSMIQLAVMMGFKEIYLMGVDFNYVIKNGIIDKASYPEGVGAAAAGAQTDFQYNLKAYQEAARYCNDKGVKIYNVSPISKLDCFEKRNFSDIVF